MQIYKKNPEKNARKSFFNSLVKNCEITLKESTFTSKKRGEQYPYILLFYKEFYGIQCRQ